MVTDECLADLACLWRMCIGVSEPTRSFFDLGGSSISAVRLSLFIEQRFGLRLSVADLRAHSTLAEMAALVQASRARDVGVGIDVSEFEDDLWLHPRLIPCEPPRTNQRRRSEPVLVTGSRGFIGGAVVRHLKDSGVPTLGVARRTAIEGDELGSDELSADLAERNWGLRSAELERLASARAIVHAGAVVDLTQDYSKLAPSNVGGTRTAVGLALTLGAPLVFTSTVFAGVGTRHRPLSEAPLQRRHVTQLGGYGLTKHVSEQIIELGRAQGLVATVLRLGDVGTVDDQPNPRSALSILLRACTVVGCRPKTAARIDQTPLSHVTAVVAALLDADPRGWPAFAHVTHGPSRAVADLLQQRLGKLPVVSADEFLRVLRAYATTNLDLDTSVLRLLALLPEAAHDPIAEIFTDATQNLETLNGDRLGALAASMSGSDRNNSMQELA